MQEHVSGYLLSLQISLYLWAVIIVSAYTLMS